MNMNRSSLINRVRRVVVILAILLMQLPAMGGIWEGDMFTVNHMHFRVVVSGIDVKLIGISTESFWGDLEIPSVVELDMSYYTAKFNVVAIEPQLFRNFNGLYSVSIPGTIPRIDNGVFMGCENLQDVFLSDGLTSIGDSTFNGCSSLKLIDLPGSLKSMGKETFAKCTALACITIPAIEPPVIQDNTFDDATYANATLYIPAQSYDAYHEADGWKNFKNIVVLHSAVGTQFTSGYLKYNVIGDNDVEVIGFDKDICPDNFKIPLTVNIKSEIFKVSKIAANAFKNQSSVKSMEIADNVVEIGEGAFMDALAMESITLPSSLKIIGTEAFRDTELLTIVLPDGLTEIGERAFYRSSLKTISIPSSVAVIKKDCFRNSFLQSVILGPGVTEINDGALILPNLTSLTCLGGTPPVASESAFNETAYSSAVLTVPHGSVEAYRSADVWKNFSTVEETTFNTFTVDGLQYMITMLGNDPRVAVCGCDVDLVGTKVLIPSVVEYGGVNYTVTSIGAGAFENCTGIECITLSNAVKTIGRSAFKGCSGLTDVLCIDSNPPVLNGESFDESAYESVSVWVSHDKVDLFKAANVWKNFKNIAGTEYGDAESSTFTVGYLKYIVLSDNELEVTGYVKENLPEHIVIPETLDHNWVEYSVTSVRGYAFSENETMISITLPNTLKYIGSSSFESCMALTSVTIPSGSIGSYAFYDCQNLSDLKIGTGLASIGRSAFEGCDLLRSVTVDAATPPECAEGCFTAAAKANGVLMVPSGKITAYRNATEWRDFSNMVENPNSAINIVKSDLTNHVVIFNLQGVKVYEGLREYVSLEPGLYIINGEKILITH